MAGRDNTDHQLSGDESLESAESYTPKQIRYFMWLCKSLGFQDDWTEAEATAFFNNLGRMLAEALEEEGKAIAEAVDRQLRDNSGA